MQKFIPLIIVVIAFIAGIGAWTLFYSGGPSTSKESVATSTPGAATSTGNTAPKVGDTTTVNGQPVKVVGKSVWADYSTPSWKIAFKYKYDPPWAVREYGDGKTLSSISFSDATTDIFLSRNSPIAEPAGMPSSEIKTTIDGYNATQHTYASPSGTYAYYDYFVFPVGGDTYYIQVKSKKDSRQDEQDFLGFIKVKK